MIMEVVMIMIMIMIIEYGDADDNGDAATSCLAGAVLSSSLRQTLDILC